MGALRHPAIRRLLVAEFVSTSGSWLAEIALWVAVAWELDGGIVELGVIGMSFAIPSFVAALAGGVWIDRLGPSRVLVLANAAGAVSSLVVVASTSLWTLALVAAVHGMLRQVLEAAALALPPRLLDDEDLLAGNALMTAAQQAAIVAGPAMGALLLTSVGARGAFAADAVTYLFALVVIVRLPTIGPAAAATSPTDPPGTTAVGGRGPSMAAEIRDGLRIAGQTPLVRRSLIVSATAIVMWSGYFVIEPIYIRDVLNGGELMLSLLTMTFGIAIVAAGLLVAVIGERLVSVEAVTWTTVGSGCCSGLYVATDQVAIAAVGAAGWGLAIGLLWSPIVTLLQRGVPADVHGRVLTLFGAMDAGSGLMGIPVSLALVPIIGPSGAGLMFSATGVVAAMCTLTAWRSAPLDLDQSALDGESGGR